jgi:hypothetical protein
MGRWRDGADDGGRDSHHRREELANRYLAVPHRAKCLIDQPPFSLAVKMARSLFVHSHHSHTLESGGVGGKGWWLVFSPLPDPLRLTT